MTGVAFNNSGTVNVQAGTLRFLTAGTSSGRFNIDASGTLAFAARQTLSGAVVTGDGTLSLTNVGSAVLPQVFEVASQDLGPTAGGFSHNFALAKLTLSNSYVRLIDTADNLSGTGPEALYVGTLQVPNGLTLDLNLLHVYTRLAQINGTITGGSLSVVPDGGTVVKNLPTPGSIAVAGEQDEWTFLGRAGEAVAIQVNPGATAQPAPLAPTLDFARVRLIDPAGNFVATAMSSVAGQLVFVPAVSLTVDGTYRVQVSATPDHSGNIGNYVLTVWDATVDTHPFVLNQQVTGLLESHFSADNWTFSAIANQQVQFHLLGAASTDIRFQLTGPNGFVGFIDLNADSGFVNLPTTGSYVLQATSNLNGFGAYTLRLDATSQTELDLGTTYHGTLPSSGFAQLFKVVVTQGSPLLINFDDATGSDHTEVYARIGSPPTRQSFDVRFDINGADHRLAVPYAAPGIWYVLVYGDRISVPSTFTLLVEPRVIFTLGATPDIGGVGERSYVTIAGLGFVPGTQFDLVPVGGGVTIPGQQVSINSTSQATAMFDLTGATLGNYDIRAKQPSGSSHSLPGGFQVEELGIGMFEHHVILPGALGRHGVATLYVEYANIGTVPIAAPILVLGSEDPDNSDRPLLTLDQSLVTQGFWTSAIPDGFANSVQIYASGATPGVLQPGERIRIPVYYAGLQQPWDFNDTAVEFELGTHTAGDTTAIDWPSLEAELRPDWIAPDVWPAVFDTLRTQIGTTWGDYVRMLADNALYLGRLGEHVNSINQLYGFEIKQALGLGPIGTLASAVDAAVPTPGLSLSFERSFGNTITERYGVGPFGRGWTASWQVSLETLADGTVIVHESADSQRRFQPDSRHAGTFFSQTGDTGVLTTVPGGFELTETSGLKTRFLANGKLSFVRDINGNQITAGFTSNLLTSLTHSSGGSVTLTYNAAGLISSVADSTGRSTTFAYDASNKHLLSATGPSGTTNYTYATGLGAHLEHALLTVTAHDGVTTHFDYDPQGRISASYLNDHFERVDYAYGTAGSVTITNAAGTSGKVYFDHRGLVLRTEDDAGNYVVNQYNADLQLIQSTDSLGRVTSFTRCDCGRPKTITDAYGRTILTFTLGGPNNAPTAFADANGNLTQYAYDAVGNLTRTTYADGTFEQATYDAHGNLDITTNRRAQTVDRTVNAAGQVTHETWSDGTAIDYTYDARGRLQSATDSHGTTTLTFDTADRLTRIDYPAGRWIQYSYEATGRRSQILDHTGFATNYEYDALGRLVRLRDATNALIDHYTYDAAGRLVREDKGNGTYTLYGYDAQGRQTSIFNHAPDDAVNSQFLYTYDAAGRRDTQTTIDGVWSYSYDLIDQLTRAVFVSSNLAIPNQDLSYEYDALGNRVRTVLNGATTIYAANNMNQYATAGGTTFLYDTDGNLVQENGPAGLKQYTYDLLNRLTRAATPTGIWQYEYDIFGNRAAVVENGVRTEYLIDPAGLGNVIGEYNGTGDRVTGYAHGLGLEGSATTVGWGYYDFDVIGSTSGLSGSVGQYVDRYAYDPWGGSLLSNETQANPFEFVGEFGVMADENGLTFMRARFYAPSVGRFLSQDPLGLGGGQINLYAYVAGNPLTSIDPTGLELIFEVEVIRGSVPAHEIPVPSSHELIFEEEVIHGTVPAHEIPVPSRLELIFEEEVIRATPPIPIPLPPTLPCKPVFGDSIDATITFTPICPPPAGVAQAVDPNEKLGAGGFGPEAYIPADTVIPYRINFENLGPGSVPTPAQPASAPAQRVEVTDQLSDQLDWDSLQFTEFGFGDTIVIVSVGRANHFETVGMTYNDQRFDVQIELTFDSSTGFVRAVFQSLDPATFLPPDVLTGFLPPEDGTGIGQAHFAYTIQVKAGLATGTELRNIAHISFDGQTDIATNQIDPQNAAAGTDPNKEALNTIDAVGPTSSVTALPASRPASFIVSWSGADDVDGSGIELYIIYVSDNGGEFAPFLEETTETSAQFSGVVGHTYAFYSIAVDAVGHVEASPEVADAHTLIVIPANQPPVMLDAEFALAENSPLNAPVGEPTADDPDVGDTVTYRITGGNVSGAFAIHPTTGALTVANPAILDFESTPTFSLTVEAKDNHGASDTATVLVKLTDVNDAPQLTLVGSAVTWIKKQPAAVVLPLSTVAGASLGGGTLTISMNAPGKKKPFDLLSPPASTGVGTSTGFRFANGHLTLQMQLAPNTSIAAIQTYLRGIKFSTKGAGLKVLTRTMTVILANTTGQSSMMTQTINVRTRP